MQKRIQYGYFEIMACYEVVGRLEPMNAKSSKWKARVGILFVAAGIGVGVSALCSGPNAFAFGVTAVVALCFVGIGFTLVGAKMISDSRRTGLTRQLQ